MRSFADTLLSEVDEFLARYDMSATRLGVLAVNDGHCVFNLRRGETCTVERADRLREFMASYEAAQLRPRRAVQRASK